jgi:outer membrane lipoprotein-sorting protein
MTENLERDRELGVALLELEVPEHRVDFDRELRSLLALERRRRRRRRQLRWTAVPALVAAAFVLGLLVGLPRTASGPSTASAARVQAKVRAAFAQAQSLSGTLVFTTAGQRTRAKFALNASGDLRTEIHGVGTAVYDAAAGVVRSLERSASLPRGPLFASVTTGYAPSGPVLAGDFTQRELAGVVRSLLVARDPRVEPVMVDGRAAWRVTLAVEPDPRLFEADRVEVTVDRKSALPLRVVWAAKGKPRASMRVENLRVDPRLPADEFRLTFPPGEVLHQDLGYRRVSLTGVRPLVGYQPFVPGTLPDGYRSAEIGAARQVSPAAGGEAPPRNAVEVSFRRGLQQFVVGSQARRGGAHDPLGGPNGERVTLHGGALDGARAEVVIDPRAVPHLWVATPTLFVIVAGDLTRDELIEVAESLHRAAPR